MKKLESQIRFQCQRHSGLESLRNRTLNLMYPKPNGNPNWAEERLTRLKCKIKRYENLEQITAYEEATNTMLGKLFDLSLETKNIPLETKVENLLDQAGFIEEDNVNAIASIYYATLRLCSQFKIAAEIARYK